MKISEAGKMLYLLACSLLPAQAGAHDYWIQARPYVADAPTEVAISLHVGTDLVGESLPNIADWYRDFSFIHDGQRKPVPGAMGDDPAGRLPADAPGLYLVGYENRPDRITLEAGKFHRYLGMEGLERIIAQRESSGQTDQPGREYYQRCVKSLVRIGAKAVSLQALSRPFGYRLEVIPLSNPYTDEQLRVQLLFDGKPQPGLLVMAFTRATPKHRQRIRTDRQGRAIITLDREGEWIVKAVHMLPYRKDDKADWISFWASLTFLR